MRKKIVSEIRQTKFERDHSLTIDGFEISEGDVFRVKGEYGSKFKFYSLTTNKETGTQWVDCFEIQKGQVGAFRSFKTDRIKRVPQRGKRAKRVNI